MMLPRIIPVLLLRNKGLVKTLKFKNPTYVGDPINAVRIFNEMEVDELVFLDITATVEKKPLQFDLIKKIATECFMPFAYGGGIKTGDEARTVLLNGAEKIIINSYAVEHPKFIKELADEFGSQSVVVSIDAKKKIFGGYEVITHGGTVKTGDDPVQFAKKMEEHGAGEIIINAIDRDGTMKGYDSELTKAVADAIDIPVVAVGGAGELEDFKNAVMELNASAAGAGSFFVFYGKHRAVLISYPERMELEKLFGDNRKNEKYC